MADLVDDWFSAKDVVDSYCGWLEVKAPYHLKPFKERLQHDCEAADAEAVVFSVLHAKRKNPRPAEIIGVELTSTVVRPVNPSSL